MTDKGELAGQIILPEEGFEAWPYYDSLRYPTIGIGKKIGQKDAPLPQFKIPYKIAYEWLKYDIGIIEKEIADRIKDLDTVRSAVLISMAYQMGVTGLIGFVNFLGALDKNSWCTAEHHMLDSLWASEKQTPERAKRHAYMIRTGKLHEYYQVT